MNKEYLINDIKTELKPILDYLKLIYINDKLKSVALRDDIKFKDLKTFEVIPKNTTKKKFISLLDWFNDNLKEFEFSLKEIKNEV